MNITAGIKTLDYIEKIQGNRSISVAVLRDVLEAMKDEPQWVDVDKWKDGVEDSLARLEEEVKMHVATLDNHSERLTKIEEQIEVTDAYTRVGNLKYAKHKPAPAEKECITISRDVAERFFWNPADAQIHDDFWEELRKSLAVERNEK